MRLLTFSKKSCQERSPLRSFMLNSDPLAGITTAIGDCASTTLLHLWSNNMRHPITEQQRKQLNCCVSLANSEKNFSPVKGDTFVTTHNKILINETRGRKGKNETGKVNYYNTAISHKIDTHFTIIVNLSRNKLVF